MEAQGWIYHDEKKARKFAVMLLSQLSIGKPEPSHPNGTGSDGNALQYLVSLNGLP